MQMKIVCKNRFAIARPQAILRGMGALQKAVDYEAVLRDAGLRITKPRRIILEILHATEGHPDAAQIFERAVAMDSRISLATVYRTMKALEESGAIQRHAFGGGPARFEQARAAHHDHLIDLDTGEVIEFASRPHRGAAGGDRRAARLRDRAPPPRALRPQDQGAGLTRGRGPQRPPIADQRERQPHRDAVDQREVRAAARSRRSAASSSGSSGRRRLAAGRAAGAPRHRPPGVAPNASASPSGR